jgi:hypothetical protein
MKPPKRLFKDRPAPGYDGVAEGDGILPEFSEKGSDMAGPKRQPGASLPQRYPGAQPQHRHIDTHGSSSKAKEAAKQVKADTGGSSSKAQQAAREMAKGAPPKPKDGSCGGDPAASR